MKNPFKDFLYFSRGERRGILVLIIGIVLIFLSGYIYSFRQNSRQLSEEESRIQAAALKEYDNFIGSVREQEKNENSRFKKSERYKKRTVVLAPFDPNRTDSVTFCRLGHLTLSKQRRKVPQGRRLQKSIWVDRRTVPNALSLHLFYGRRHYKKGDLSTHSSAGTQRQYL